MYVTIYGGWPGREEGGRASREASGEAVRAGLPGQGSPGSRAPRRERASPKATARSMSFSSRSTNLTSGST